MSAPNCVLTFILPKSCDTFKNCSVSTTKCVQTQDRERIYLADISPIVLMPNKVCNEEEPHYMAATLSYFLWASGGGGEQTNYIFHMDYNATSFSSSISANLGNSGEAIHKYSVMCLFHHELAVVVIHLTSQQLYIFTVNIKIVTQRDYYLWLISHLPTIPVMSLGLIPHAYSADMTVSVVRFYPDSHCKPRISRLPWPSRLSWIWWLSFASAALVSRNIWMPRDAPHRAPPPCYR